MENPQKLAIHAVRKGNAPRLKKLASKDLNAPISSIEGPGHLVYKLVYTPVREPRCRGDIYAFTYPIAHQDSCITFSDGVLKQ